MKRLYFSIILTVLGSLFLIGWGLDKIAENSVSAEQPNESSAEIAVYKKLIDGFSQELSKVPFSSIEQQTISLQQQFQVEILLEQATSIALPAPLNEQLSQSGGLLLSSEQGTYLLKTIAKHPNLLIKILLPQAEQDHFQQDVLMTLMLYIGVCAIVILWLLPLTRRLYLLNEAAAKIGAGQFEQRVPHSRYSYIGMLEESFNRMAEQIQVLIADNKILARSLSHDIRTPMACLRFGIDAARDTTDLNKKNKYIDRMDDELTRMEDMTSAFLEYASLERHGFHLQLENIDLNALVESVCADCSQLAKQHHIELTFIPTDDIALSQLDFHWCYRAVQNLLSNAIQYAEHKAVLTIVKKSQSMRLIIEDDGQGIPEDKLDTIFEPFIKLDENRSREQGNFGLGLAITTKVLNWHHAQVQVKRSQQLGGACFIVDFPIHKS